MTFDSYVNRKKTVLKKTTLPTMEDFAKRIVEDVKETSSVSGCSIKEAFEACLKNSTAGKGTIRRAKEILDI